jgi:hypothetical protein
MHISLFMEAYQLQQPTFKVNTFGPQG